MTERAIVILRLKDNIPEEKRIWQIKDNKLYQIKNNTSISYTCFDYVVDKKTNKQLFEAYFEKSVDEVCSGINLTIFAYGQTGSGKTHSMFGNEKEKGIIYYSLKKLLTKIKELKISFIEIYNEKIFDLIDPKRKVCLYNVFNEPNLTGNSVLRITKVEEIEELIKKCEVNRKTSVTEYNQRSSRSHTFFEISFELNDKKVIFNLIDLAGSEKASSDLERRKEGSFINKSLLSLGTVINNLSEKDYTSFRESKLTRLLQPSMEGNSNLIALCLINPQEDCSDESVSTLNFASRVGKIRFTKKVEEYSSVENDNFYLLCEKCKSTFVNKSDLPIENRIIDKSNQSNNQSNITDIKQTLEIKEESKFTEMKKQRTKLEMSVLEYKNTLQNDLINKQEEKNVKNEEMIVTKENVSEDFQEKTGVLEVTNIRSENDTPNKEPNTLNTNNEILYFSPSHEEPLDIFNIYFTDDSKTSYFNEITTSKKKGRIEEKVEYLTKKINLYQERVDELEKAVYDLISNDIDNNQKNMFNLEKKMFYCKNKILDNQYEDFFN